MKCSGVFLIGVLAMSALAVDAKDDVVVATRSQSTAHYGYLDDKTGNDVVETRAGTLYYNKSSGQAMVAGVNADGDPSFRVDYNFGPGWEKIVSVGDSLFFYATDGRAVVGYIDSQEQFIETKSYPAGTFKTFNKALASLDSLQRPR